MSEEEQQYEQPQIPEEQYEEPEEVAEPEPVVDEKKMEIAGKFLSEAPPGEFDDCVAAIDQFIEEPNFAVVAKKRYLENWMMRYCVAVPIAGRHAIICEEARLPDGEYVDPNTMKAFRYNFETRTVEEGSGRTIESSSLRSAMQPVVQKFAEKSMRNGNCAVYDVADGVSIVISGSTISKKNYRTGSLVMRFNLSSSGQLTGKIVVYAHFYENGNSVGEQVSEYNDVVSGANDDDLSVNLVKKITNFYTKWTSRLQDGFETLSREGLDQLRRKLPITQTHVNWRQEIIGAAAMPAGKGK